MNYITKTLFVLILILNNAFAVVYSADLPVLTFTKEQKSALDNTAELLQKYHYSKLPLDKERSTAIFNNYLRNLDYYNTFFTAEDVARMAELSDKFSLFVKNAQLEPAFNIHQLYMERMYQYITFMQDKLNEGLENIDFTTDDTLQVDRSKSPRVNNYQDLKDLWLKLFKDEVLRLKIAKKDNQQITELLNKRYANRLKRLMQTKSEDVFSIYMNSITSVYDPHTGYLSPDMVDNFNINMSLSLKGIGATLTTDGEYTKIVSLVPASPAANSGQLFVNDRIIGVAQENADMIDVIGWRLDEVVGLIRGSKGSLVTLEVISSTNAAGDETSKLITLMRDDIKLEDQAASSHIFDIDDKKIGLIKIPSFYMDFESLYAGDKNYKSTTRDVRKILANFQKNQVDGVVIDLRNNGGGSLQEALELSSLFIGAKPVVLVRNSLGKIEVLLDDRQQKPLYRGSLTVLINRQSASASEIFAGAMQDYHRALIVGEQTYGKGTVQSIQNLSYGKLKLTVAKFYRVSGTSTQRRGVQPDIAFPAILDVNEIGESSLPFALEWDTVEQVVSFGNNHFANYIEQLQKNHQQRVDVNTEFAYIKKVRTFNSEMADRNIVSLNEQKRLQEYSVIEKRKLEIENSHRKARNEPLLVEITPEDDDALTEEPANAKPDLSKDAYLDESVKITLDYLTLLNAKLVGR